MKQLRIFFKDTELQEFSWCFLSANKVVEKGNQSDSTFARWIKKTNDIVFVLPHSWLYFTHIDTEGKSAKSLLAAAAYQLEEQVGEDVDDLHFAQGNSNNAKVNFAVIKHSLMRDLAAFEKNYHINAKTIISEMELCVSPQAGDINIILLDQRYLIKSAIQSESTVCAEDQLDFYLLQFFSQYDESHRKLLTLNDLFTAPLELATVINLKQKQYSEGHAWQSMSKLYVLPLMLILLCTAAFIFHQWQSIQTMRQTQNDLITQQKRIVKRAIRTYDNKENPKRALIKALQNQQAGTQESGFLAFFHQFLESKKTVKSISITKINYLDEKLTVDINAVNLQDLDKLIESLKSNFKVTVSQMDSSNNQNKGRLILERVK